MITSKQYKALKIVAEKADKRGTIRASEFALSMWGSDITKEHLFNSVSNQGDGACSRKKAWRCAGGYLGRLNKAGLVKRVGYCFYISQKGKEAILEYEKGGKQ